MWLLESTSDKDVKYPILGENKYVVGRMNCDIVVSDPSVSRKQALLSMIHSESNVVKSFVIPTLTLEDTSKFGTFVNGNRVRSLGGAPVSLKDGDEIRFGGNAASIFKAIYQPFIATTSCLEKAPKKLLHKVMCRLGGHVVRDWRNTCTLLIMSKINVTIKVICAINNQKHIVTPQYLEHLHAHLLGEREKPDPVEYLPEIVDKEVPPGVSFHPDIRRLSLLSGLRFYFLSAVQFNKTNLAVSTAGGLPILLEDGTEEDIENMGRESTIVVSVTPDVLTSLSSLCQKFVRMVCAMLNKKNLRTVTDPEIGWAILTCNTDDFCNPKSAITPNMYSSMASQSLSQAVDAGQTQDTSGGPNRPRKRCAVVSESEAPESSSLVPSSMKTAEVKHIGEGFLVPMQVPKRLKLGSGGESTVDASVCKTSEEANVADPNSAESESTGKMTMNGASKTGNRKEMVWISDSVVKEEPVSDELMNAKHKLVQGNDSSSNTKLEVPDGTFESPEKKNHPNSDVVDAETKTAGMIGNSIVDSSVSANFEGRRSRSSRSGRPSTDLFSNDVDNCDDTNETEQATTDVTSAKITRKCAANALGTSVSPIKSKKRERITDFDDSDEEDSRKSKPKSKRNKKSKLFESDSEEEVCVSSKQITNDSSRNVSGENLVDTSCTNQNNSSDDALVTINDQKSSVSGNRCETVKKSLTAHTRPASSSSNSVLSMDAKKINVTAGWMNVNSRIETEVKMEDNVKVEVKADPDVELDSNGRLLRNVCQVKVVDLVTNPAGSKVKTRPSNEQLGVKNFKQFRKTQHTGANTMPTIIGGSDLEAYLGDKHKNIQDLFSQNMMHQTEQEKEERRKDELFSWDNNSLRKKTAKRLKK